MYIKKGSDITFHENVVIIHTVAVNVKENKLEPKDFELPVRYAKYNEDVIYKTIRERYGKVAVNINGMETAEKIYTMSFSDFVGNDKTTVTTKINEKQEESK